jgi:hypothetical protein
MTCSNSSAAARIGSSSGAHRAMQSLRRSWQVAHSLRWRDTDSRKEAGSTGMKRRPASFGTPACWASESICPSSAQLGAALPIEDRTASAAASAMTSKARSIACRFSRRSRRTSATVVPSSRAAFRLSRPLATNKSYIRCRGSGSVATICSSQRRSDAMLAGASGISGTSAMARARTAAQLMSSILAGCPCVRQSWAAMPSSQPRSLSGRGSLTGSAIASRAAIRTSLAAATAASASGHSRSAQAHSSASRCWRTTSANTPVRSRFVWACLNRRTSAASACPRSFAVMDATIMPFNLCWSAGCQTRRTEISGYYR